MSSTPFVSVVMNGFNSAEYLQEAIDSLLAQTFTDWEMVFWDNQSEDATAAIVQAVTDSRVRFHCSDRRMSLAEGRNEAIARTSGRWIAFLDCDDRWSNDKLARQIERLSAAASDKVGLVYARTMSFSARGPEGETTYRYTGRPLPEGNIIKLMLTEGNLIPIVSALVRREAFDAVGPIPLHYTFAEDYFLFTAIAERYEVLCVQEACCEYRVHPNSATARNKIASHVEGLAVLEHFSRHLEPAALRRRRAIYGTLLGLELMRHSGKRLQGLLHLMRHGSLTFLVGGMCRTFVRRFLLGRRPFS